MTKPNKANTFYWLLLFLKTVTATVGTLRVPWSSRRCGDAGLSCCWEPKINSLNTLTKDNHWN